MSGRARALLREADLLLNVAGINRVSLERARADGRRSTSTSIPPSRRSARARATAVLRARARRAAACSSPIGENIGTPRSRAPDRRLSLAADAAAGRARALGRPDPPRRRIHDRRPLERTQRRDITFAGRDVPLAQAHRVAALSSICPRAPGAELELAMDVEHVPGDVAVLAAHGWQVADPLAGLGRSLARTATTSGLARRVHGGEGPERPAAERLVQRSRRVLPGRRPAGGRAGHRRSATCCRSARAFTPSGRSARRRRRSSRSSATMPRRRRTRRPSRRSISAPTVSWGSSWPSSASRTPGITHAREALGRSL